LKKVDVGVDFSIVEDWWFNIDLNGLFARLPIPEEQKRLLLDSMKTELDTPRTEFEHDGKKYTLCYMGLNSSGSRYQRSNQGEYYLELRNRHLVGAAWDEQIDDLPVYQGGEDYDGKVEISIQKPSLVFSVFPKTFCKNSQSERDLKNAAGMIQDTICPQEYLLKFD